MYYSPINLDNGSALRDIYPTARGNAVTTQATGANAGASSTGNTDSNLSQTQGQMEVSKALSVGDQANVGIGLLVFVVLVFGTMLLARHLGESEDFKNLKPSVYNVVVISLAAIAGIPLWKWIFTKLPVPGVSTWVHAV